jgi:hypothetical protein
VDQVYWIQFLEGVELLLLKESGLAHFVAKVAPSLNELDRSEFYELSYWIRL